MFEVEQVYTLRGVKALHSMCKVTVCTTSTLNILHFASTYRLHWRAYPLTCLI